MNHEKIIRSYYTLLEERNYNDLMKLFAPEAVVVHPIYDTLQAGAFFKILLDKAESHKITIINILQAIDQPNRLACYLKVEFETKNKNTFIEEAMHLYDFSDNGLITKLTVIVDTFSFRSEYAL